MDYRDQQLHDFEENGTRDDCITERSDRFSASDDEEHEDRMEVIRRAAVKVRERSL